MKQKKRWRFIIIFVLVTCFLFSVCQFKLLNLSGDEYNKIKTLQLHHSSSKLKSKYVNNYFLY